MSTVPVQPQQTATDRRALDELIPAIYDELRAVARRLMAGERAAHTLQTTALVHEAYVRFAGQRNLSPLDRGRFLAIAANTIRRVLVDHAKRRRAAKRGGSGRARVDLECAVDVPAPDGTSSRAQHHPDVDELIKLDDALERLARRSTRAAQVVTLRYFGGLTVEQTADALELSPRTVAEEWAVARAWLRREVRGA